MAGCSWSSGLINAPTVHLNIYQNSNSNSGTYSLVMKRPGYIASSDLKNFSVTINGTKVKSGSAKIGGSGDLTLASGSWTVPRNPNGQTHFSFSFYTELGLTWSGKPTGNATGNGSTTIYYPKATYIVSYNPNGGSGAPSSQTKTYGATLKLSSIIPIKTGHTFLGWSTSNDNTVEYRPGNNYTSNSSITLYAVWKLNIYNVTFDCACGTINGNNSYIKQISHGSRIGTLPLPIKENYTFLGWYSNDEKIDENYVITKSIVFIAKWKMNAVAYNKINNIFELCTPIFKINNEWYVSIMYKKVNGEWERSVM